MADTLIHEIPTTATSFASDDYIVLDGVTNGTRNMTQANLKNSVVAGNIAPLFDPNRTSSDAYAIDDLVIYQGQLYKCTTAHSGAWTDGHFTATNADTEMAKAKYGTDEIRNLPDKNEGYLALNDANGTGKMYSDAFAVMEADKLCPFTPLSDWTVLTGYRFTDSAIVKYANFIIAYVPVRKGQGIKVRYLSDEGGFRLGFLDQVPAINLTPSNLFSSAESGDFYGFAPIDGYLLVSVRNDREYDIALSESDTVKNIVLDSLIAENILNDENLTTLIISSITGKWFQSVATYCKVIKLPKYAKKIKLLSNRVNPTNYAFLKDTSGVAEDYPAYCDGYPQSRQIVEGFGCIDVPSDARYLYVHYGQLTKTVNSLYDYKPKALSIDAILDSSEIPVDSENIDSKNVERALSEIKSDATGIPVVFKSENVDFTSLVTGCIRPGGEWNTTQDAKSIKVFAATGYNIINVKANAERSCRVTFAKKALPSSTRSLKNLISGGYLCNDIPFVKVDSNVTADLQIPSDAVYIYITSVTHTGTVLTPSSATLIDNYVPATSSTESIDELCRSRSHVIPNIILGYYNSDGKYIDSEVKAHTNTVYGDFYCQLNEGYEIDYVHLFNDKGKMICYNYFTPTSPEDVVDNESVHSDNPPNRTFFGTMNLGRNKGVRIVIKKSDGSDFNGSESPFKIFAWCDDSHLVWEHVNNAGYSDAVKRAIGLAKVMWTAALGDIPSTKAASIDAHIRFNSSSSFFGVPYSSVKETRKYIGYNVSLRTFMTALQNKRSLIYTENVDANYSRSGYGYIWHGVNTTMAYYGLVCSNYISYVFGLPFQYVTRNWGLIPGMTQVTGIDATNIQPMMSITNSHHTFICLGVLNDVQGNRKVVVIAESVTPCIRITPYTVDRLQERFDSEAHTFWTYANLADNAGWITKYPADRQFTEYEFDDVPQEYSYNRDICTFAGDYASFATSDDIYLNAVPGEQYTAIELYKDDVLIQVVDISSLSPDADGYVDVDVTGYTTGYGKYKARLADVGGNYSDYCYFERIDIQMEISGNTLSFSSSNGNPVTVSYESGLHGGIDSERLVTSQEITDGIITIHSSYIGVGKYVRISVQGDYGMPTRRMLIP